MLSVFASCLLLALQQILMWLLLSGTLVSFVDEFTKFISPGSSTMLLRSPQPSHLLLHRRRWPLLPSLSNLNVNFGEGDKEMKVDYAEL